METVKQALERLGLETLNVEHLEDPVIRIEETSDGARLFIAPGYYVTAYAPDHE